MLCSIIVWAMHAIVTLSQRRGSGSVTNQHPISELAGLHAALSSEGVQVLHSPTQHQPHQQYRQPLQQPQLQPPSPLRAGLQQHRQHTSSKQHAAQSEAQLFEPPTDKSGELQRLGTQIHTITAALQGIACREGQQPPSTSSGFLSSRAHGATAPGVLQQQLLHNHWTPPAWLVLGSPCRVSKSACVHVIVLSATFNRSAQL